VETAPAPPARDAPLLWSGRGNVGALVAAELLIAGGGAAAGLAAGEDEDAVGVMGIGCGRRAGAGATLSQVSESRSGAPGRLTDETAAPYCSPIFFRFLSPASKCFPMSPFTPTNTSITFII
jgi:hypothetical protein